MKTRYIAIPIVMIAVLALVALSTPVMAYNVPDDLETRCWGGNCLNGTITNGTVIVLCNMTGLPDMGNWTFTLPSGTVEIAYMHWHRWGACHGTAITAEFWNGTGAYESIGFPYPGEDNAVYEDHGVWWTDYSPRHGNHHYYWKVNASEGTNTFNATGCYKTPNTAYPGEHCDARWFIAVINETDADNSTHDGHWWHNTGYAKTTSSVERETKYYNATGDPINTSANYTLWTAQTHYGDSNPDPSIDFNGQSVGNVGSDCDCHGVGMYADFSLCEFNVNHTYIEADGDQNVKWTYEGDPYYVNFGTLAEVLPKPDLVITDIKPNETMMRANKNYKINATVKNMGSDGFTTTFNLSLYVNGTYHNKTTVSGGMAIGESEEKTFALPVNLPKGCHNFTVVADCDADVPESDETNNATTEFYQVGYHLVVENNGDFDDLVTESENGAFGDGDVTKIGNTYYIRNFTGDYGIQNCAGCGISIKDTTAPFVIQNCTVHDCSYKGSSGDSGGICLDNVTNETIGNCINTSTIENNTGSGIRVKNSTYVNITDNTIQNNTQYGIYASPEQLPVTSETRDDCKFINVTDNTVTKHGEGVDLMAYNCTVKNNTITDSATYGMYMMGNYSNVTDNVIQNSTGYAIKAYNSSHNYIYENDFICNNVTGHQAWDNKNSNHWNTSSVGNNWTDWDDNAGAPGDYNIDGGGGNKDYKPLGLYVFSCNASVDKWAFWKQLTQAQFISGSSTHPSTEFSQAAYDKIAEDDDVSQDNVTDTGGQYAAHRFNVSVDVTSGIDKINVTWIGKGDHQSAGATDGAKLYIFNFSATAAPYYEQLASTTSSDERTLTGGKTNTTYNIFDYINGNNVTILVNQTSAHIATPPQTSRIWTDYIELVITPE